MSRAATAARPAARPGATGRSASRRTEAPRPTLKVVPPSPWRAPRAPFVMLSLAVVSLGLLGLLGLNTVVAQNAFTLDRLERRSVALAADEQRLEREVATLEAPGQLAARAQALGLVPATDPAFLRLSDGKVLGVPRAATAPPKPAATRPAAAVTSGPAAASASAKPSQPGARSSAKPAARTPGQTRPTPTPSGSPR